jgi:hypothetical protein
MSNKISIKLDEDILNKIRRYNFEYDMRADICQRIINRSEEINSESLTYYEKLCLESKNMFENVKDEFSKVYLEPIVDSKWGINSHFIWYIPDYSRLECIVEKVD